MKVLVIQCIYAYIDADIVCKLREMGHSVILESMVEKRGKDMYLDPPLQQAIYESIAHHKPDVVYSTNFFPLIARSCSDLKKPYVAWCYDTPPQIPKEEDMDYATNHIYFFNDDDCERYKEKGIKTVASLPLAVNCDRLTKSAVVDRQYQAQVSFVGNLYHSTLPVLKSYMSEYERGWLDGIVETQRNLNGIFFVDELLSDDIVEAIQREVKKNNGPEKINSRQLSYAVASYLTYLDRLSLLKVMSERYDTTVYTSKAEEKEKELLPSVHWRDPVDYTEQMPLVFKNSKINLCPVLRNNTRGVPLRALDVMGCGGFLMSGFHKGIAETFENGKELVMYHSLEEAVEMADYYLRHDEERRKIAEAGFVRICKDFRYEDRLNILFGGV